MMNKKLFLILGMFLLVLAPLASAITLSDPSTWDDSVKFHEESPNGKYGYYEIADTLLWVFNKKQIKTVELLENDYSVLSAWNIKQIEVFEPTKLFDRTDYYAKDKETDKSSAIKSEQHLYRQLVNKTRYIPVNGDCTQYNTITNETNSTTYCIEYEDLGYEETYKDWTDWEEYNWGSVQPGLYQTKTIVTRSNQYTGIVDWIDTSEGHSLNEWAVWWNDDWDYYREIPVSENSGSSLTNYSVAINITDSTNMNTNFSDLRFVDSTNTVELGYWIEDKLDGEWAYVWFKIPSMVASQNTTVYMYYGNAVASSASDIDNAFIMGDDFSSGSVDFTNKWQSSSQGSYTVVSGEMNLADLSATEDMICTKNSYTNKSVEFLFGNKGDASDSYTMLEPTAGTYSGTGQFRIWTSNFVRLNWGVGVSDVSSPDYNAMYKVIKNNVLEKATVTQVNNPAKTTTANGTLVVDTYYPCFFSWVGTKSYMDNFFVREQATVEPTYVIGSEQINVGVTLIQIYPTNALIIDEQYLNYTYNITADGPNFTNTTMTIWNDTDDTVHLTNFTSLSGNTSQIINYTNTLPDGDWKWNAEVCTSDDACTTGSNRTYTIDTVPQINITYPSTGLNILVSEVWVNVSLTEKWFDELILNLNYTNGTLANTTTITDSTRSFLFGDVNDGNYVAEAIVSTTTGQSNSSTTGSFLVHTSIPIINISAPSGTLGSITIGDNETLSYSIFEIGQNISHFDECWFEYNNTEVLNNISFDGFDEWVFPSNYANVTKISVIEAPSTLVEFESIPENCSRRGNFSLKVVGFISPFQNVYSCKDVEDNYLTIGVNNPKDGQAISANITTMQKRPLNCSENTAEFEYVLNNNALCVHAIDEFGLHTDDTTSWQYKVVETDPEYNDETYEGTYETFSLNIYTGTTLSVASVVLNYDGQSSTSNLFVSGESVSAVSNFIVTNVENDENKTFYFTVTMSDSSTFNTTSYTQLVKNIGIDNCSNYTNEIFTANLYDEETLSAISGTIMANLDIINSFNDAEILSFSEEINDTSSISLCSDINLSSSGALINLELRYYSENHSAEFYHIQRANISEYPQNISLYDLLEEDTTKFKLTYQNENLIGVDGAIIQLQRKYISDGIYRVVEAPLTSSESTAIVHIDTNTNKYQIYVVKNGEVLGFFENLAFICQSELTGECELNLFDTLEAPNFQSIDDINDFSFIVTPDEDNKKIGITYTVPSGSNKLVNIELTQKDLIGTSTKCNTSVLSSGGSIECSYNESIDDSLLYLRVFADGELAAKRSYSVKEGILADFQGVNYFILIILLLSVSFMAITSPEWMIVNSILTVVIGGATWLIKGFDFTIGLGGIIWLIIAGVLIIIKMAKKER